MESGDTAMIKPGKPVGVRDIDWSPNGNFIALLCNASGNRTILCTASADGDAFNIILDIKISDETTPHLYMMLRRTLADAGLSTYSAKDHYMRLRPFMVNNTPICTPEEEAMLREDGSYPSGHTAIGWAWALILAEVFPEQSNVVLKRGKEFGISRNVCNVHWHSDVLAGRLMGAAVVAKLHANNQFNVDMEAVKEEISKHTFYK